jgi:hypothetical protein
VEEEVEEVERSSGRMVVVEFGVAADSGFFIPSGTSDGVVEPLLSPLFGPLSRLSGVY